MQAALHAAPAGTPAPLTAAVPREVAAQVLTLIRERRPSPPRAARLLALTLIAVNDTERAAQGSRRAVNTDLAARIAAGGVLAMVVDTMIPEAFAETHDFAGLITVTGFLAAFALSKLGG